MLLYKYIVETIKKTFKEKPKHQLRFELNGVKYGMIPDLDNMTIGEYVDLDKYISSVDEWHKLLAVLYRPITNEKGDKYLIEEYEGSDKYSEQMKQAPLDIVLGVNVFFYALGIELLKHTVKSLEVEADQNTQVKQLLQENGDGISQYMEWLEETSCNLMPSLN